MFERYTEPARRTIFFARYEASQFGSPHIESEHLLLALCREDPVLRRLASCDTIRKRIEARVKRQERISTSVDLPVSQEVRRILSYGANESERLGAREIDCLHLTLGVLREEKCVAAELLRELKVDREALLAGFRSWPATESTHMPSVGPLAQRLAGVIGAARLLLESFSEAEAFGKHQRLGHLIDLAAAYHSCVLRALNVPRVEAPPMPRPEFAAAVRYEELPWRQLLPVWLQLSELLLHVLSRVPEERYFTPCRIGDEPDVTLEELVKTYALTMESRLRELIRP